MHDIIILSKSILSFTILYKNVIFRNIDNNYLSLNKALSLVYSINFI